MMLPCSRTSPTIAMTLGQAPEPKARIKGVSHGVQEEAEF